MLIKSLFFASLLLAYAGAMAIPATVWSKEQQKPPSSAAVSKQAITKDSAKAMVVKPATEQVKAKSVMTMAELVGPGFRDDDDDSSLPFLATPAELKRLGIQRGHQEIPAFAADAMRTRQRVTPVLQVRIRAILTAHPNGSSPATITPAQIRQLVDQANRVWWPAGIEFLFDPEKDVETLTNTLIHERNPVDEFAQNRRNPDWDTDSLDAAPQHNARTYVALERPHKLVVFFAHSFGYAWDETLREWYMKPAGGFSGHDLEYVFMPNGMPEKNLLAHELGHYLHLPHPFVPDIETVSDATQAIKDWVENQGHAPKQGPLVFDGDNKVRYATSPVDIKDTPPDPNGQIFSSIYEPGAKCMEAYDTIEVPVTFSNGKHVVYELKPDRQNIMSYYKGCHNLGLNHVSEGQIAASRNALLNGNRLSLLTPTIERMPVMQKKASK